VFDVRAGLANVHHALAVGGRAIHVAPTSNQIDHGFYSFSPTLFGDYYRANGYRMPELLLFQARDFEAPWTVYRYEPDRVSSRFHDVRVSGVTMAGVWVVVEKTAESTCTAAPQQGQYVEVWRGAEGSPAGAEPPSLRRAIRDGKRRLDRALPILNARPMPRKIGIFGRG
jgi:hypothetical protein